MGENIFLFSLQKLVGRQLTPKISPKSLQTSYVPGLVLVKGTGGIYECNIVIKSVPIQLYFITVFVFIATSRNTAVALPLIG